MVSFVSQLVLACSSHFSYVQVGVVSFPRQTGIEPFQFPDKVKALANARIFPVANLCARLLHELTLQCLSAEENKETLPLRKEL